MFVKRTQLMRELTVTFPPASSTSNDQTVDAQDMPFGGQFTSGTGSRSGGSANIGACTGMRWITMRREIAPYRC